MGSFLSPKRPRVGVDPEGADMSEANAAKEAVAPDQKDAKAPPPEAEVGEEGGRVIDKRYELIDVLGEGGFGVVYKARQISTKQVVAIKLLHSDLLDDSAHAEEYIARFEREMSLIGKLKHPNIVRLIDQGVTEEGELYMALEYIDGQSLAEVLYHQPLSLYEALHIMMQVLDALSAAHKIGIVHRDLKPGNIMLTSTGYRRNAMVLDFGIAGVVAGQRGVDYKTLTRASDIRGTPAYMAPEQLQSKTLTPQSDVYAWGLVFIECLTGEVVVPGESPFEIAIQQVSDDPNVVPDGLMGDSLYEIIAKSVAKPMTERYITVEEVFEAMDQANVLAVVAADACLNLDSSSTMPLTKQAADKAMGRKTSAGEIGVAETAMMDSGALAEASRTQSLNSQVDIAAVGKRSRFGLVLAIALLVMVAVNGAGWWYLTQFGNSPKAEESPPVAQGEDARLTEARELMAQEPSPENTLEASEWLRESIKANEEAPVAKALLARVLTLRAREGWDPSEEALREARELAKEAMTEQANLADAYVALARVSLYLEHDWGAADSGFSRATELDPLNGALHAVELLGPRGRFDEAKVQLEIARRGGLGPVKMAHCGAVIAYLAGNFEVASTQAQAILEIRPDSYWGHYWLGLALAGQQDFVKARASLETARSVREDASVDAALAWISAMQGEIEQARGIIDMLIDREAVGAPVPLAPLALVMHVLGENDKAFELLERAVSRFDASVVLCERDPRFLKLRSDPRYSQLRTKLGLLGG